MSAHKIILSNDPINVDEALTHISNPKHGGTATFIGTIRNRNQSRDVVSVHYDIMDSLAHNTIQQLCLDAEKKFSCPYSIYIGHRKGEIKILEKSIIIAVSSPHRKEAFDGCRFLIEKIKHECPIWKKEFYTDGESEWIKGHALCQH
jgi:molybdopterin synthase catalytic subunit